MKLKVVLFSLVAAAMGLAANAQAQSTPPVLSEYVTFQQLTEVLLTPTLGGGGVVIYGVGPYDPSGTAPIMKETVQFNLKSSDSSQRCYKLAKFAKTNHLPYFITGWAYPASTATAPTFLSIVTDCATKPLIAPL